MTRAAICLLLTGSVLALAQDAPSGSLKKGDDVPSSFRSYVVWDKRYPVPAELNIPDERKRDEVMKAKPGLPKVVVDSVDLRTLRDVRDRTDRPHDLVGEYGLDPVVAVFAPDIPAAGGLVDLLQKLDKAASFATDDTPLSNPRFNTAVSFLVLRDELELGAPRELLAKKAADLGRAVKDSKSSVTIALAQRKSKATAAWKLDGGTATTATVVLYNKLRVLGVWTFEIDKAESAAAIVKPVLDAVDSELGDRKK